MGKLYIMVSLAMGHPPVPDMPTYTTAAACFDAIKSMPVPPGQRGLPYTCIEKK